MFRSLRQHIAGQSVGYLALFFAMSGTAVAASSMWTGANIVDGSLTGADVQNGSLTGADIQSGSITSSDLAPGASTGGSQVVTRFDSTTTYDFPAGQSAQVIAQTFTMPTGGFVTVSAYTDVTPSSDLGCLTPEGNEHGDNMTLDASVSVDGLHAASAGGYDLWTRQPSQQFSSLTSNWLPAGQHQLRMDEVQYQGCRFAGIAGDPVLTPTGSYHLSNIHVVVTLLG